MKTFQELGVSGEIRRAIEEMGYENPMPVQEEVIPYLLGDGNDVVALAQTGTGKTAAFGLPILQKININDVVPQALVLCPTRELCLQIAGDLTDYSKYMDNLKILPVYGGSSIESQIRSLKKGVHVIVATPGRLIDLMERRVAHLDNIVNVVMDEADEMLNMGFTESINAILEKVPEDRNTLMFSATMSPEIARIAHTYLRNAKEITIGTKNEGSSNVKHIGYVVQAKDKYLALKRVVDFYPQVYGIVFCRTRKETQEIADMLIKDGYNADSLHGELSQPQRDLVMQKFRQRHLQLLVATDVAARGLDVNDLTHVINYGLPDDTESYTHRSGRTGRAGKTGISIAIMNMREKTRMKEIERIIKKKFDICALPTGKEICEQQLIKVIDDIEKVKVNEEEIETFLPGIYRKWEWLSKEDLIKRVVSIEFNRFLNYYQHAEDIEEVKWMDGKNERKERKNADKDKSARKAEQGFVRFFLNQGKTDGVYASQIIELINRNMKRERVEIGRIDLMQNFSFFEVAEHQANAVRKALSKATLKGRNIIVEPAGENNGKSDKAGKKKEKVNEQTKNKRSREERGYSEKRGPIRKDDWMELMEAATPKGGYDFSAFQKKKKKK